MEEKMASSAHASQGNALSAGDILDCLENGNLSDLEIIDDPESEDELLVPNINQQVTKRIGADEVSRNEAIDCDDVNNEVSPQVIDNVDDSVTENASSGFQFKDIVTSRKDIQWRKSRRPFLEHHIMWEEELSDNSDLIQLETPLVYFKRYIGNDIFKLISDCTNIYALQNNVNNFKNTSPEEIEILFALHIVIGCLKFPRVRLFWDNILGIAIFKENMSRDRFFQLRSNLHLVNNLERPAGCRNKMFKVQPIYDSILRRCNQLNIEQNICIEQMVPFRGQLSIKQYVKNKPNPWGIKIFLLCGRSGLVYNLLIYQGATTGLDGDNLKTLGLGASVVLHLTENISKAGHKLFFDNYFSSYQVLQILLNNNIHAAGTIRINRFANPPLLSDKDMKKKERGSHDEVVDRNEDIVLVKWLDNRTVHLASNFVGAEERDTVRRWSKLDNKYIEISRPNIVKQYNHSMGGVDLIDQLISLYRVYIRSKKWTLRMIFHAVDLALANSWIEYKMDCEKLSIPKKNVMDLLAFRMSVAGDLINVGKTIQKKRGRPSAADDDVIPFSAKRANCEVRPSSSSQSDRVDHMPHLDGQVEGKRCKRPNCSKKTHFFCDKCGVHLCITKERNCFVSFHRK